VEERGALLSRDKHAVPAPDLLSRNYFDATSPDRLWTADITYDVGTQEGFVYLSFILDVYSRRKVVGCGLCPTNTSAQSSSS
jgi:transposase InsO family protein